MAQYAIWVQIAEICIKFESSEECDIQELKKFFKYHLVDSALTTDCIVELKRQASFFMPKDAELQWQSEYSGIVKQEKRQGRRRISSVPDLDTRGFATCYWSSECGEYYYGLMHDQSWLCFSPSAHRIKYVLHRRPSRKNDSEFVETIDPINAVPLLIHIISAFYGRFLVHGAAVSLDRKSSLFLGKSGSGKSTLSTDFAKLGALFMGDDLVLLYMKEGVPMVGSLVLPAKLYMDNMQEKTSVDVPEQMKADYCLYAPLQTVYLVQQSGILTSNVESRPQIELLQQLMEASNDLMMQYDKQQWLHTLYCISEQVPYYIFHYGDRSSLNKSILQINN